MGEALFYSLCCLMLVIALVIDMCKNAVIVRNPFFLSIYAAVLGGLAMMIGCSLH